MGPTRQIYWNIAGHVLIYGFLLVALTAVGYRIRQRVRLWRLGTAEPRLDQIGKRIRFALAEIFLQRRQLREPFMGVAHLFIFYGFLAELVATSMISIQEWTGVHFLKGTFYLYYSLFSDGFGIIGIIGLLMALWYRGLVKPARFHTIADDWVAVLLLLTIFIQGFVVEGLRIAVTELRVQPELAPWSPGGYLIALMLQNLETETLLLLHRYNWWLHAATAFVFIGYFAFGKFKHVLFGTINLFLRSLEPSGSSTIPTSTSWRRATPTPSTFSVSTKSTSSAGRRCSTSTPA
jgi:nitrate reductase gamma subunit